jgi:hypothetical protein
LTRTDDKIFCDRVLTVFKSRTGTIGERSPFRSGFHSTELAVDSTYDLYLLLSCRSSQPQLGSAHDVSRSIISFLKNLLQLHQHVCHHENRRSCHSCCLCLRFRNQQGRPWEGKSRYRPWPSQGSQAPRVCGSCRARVAFDWSTNDRRSRPNEELTMSLSSVSL